MMAIPTSTVQVYVGSEDSPLLVGSAFINTRRKIVTTTFRYDDAYLANPLAWPVSPDLPLRSQVSINGLPGAMADSAPDRWGRRLIERRISAQAREEGRSQREVTEIDYLLGVSDLMRHGALRYRTIDSDDFLAQGVSVPLLVDLPKVLNATDALANADTDDDMTAIKFLLQAGSSALGGARPKASVRDGNRLHIAKFPHKSDEWDVITWEKVSHELASRCGIEVPESRLENIGGRNILLLERFDREGANRIPYISGMTMLGGVDGGRYDYIDLAEAISNHGSFVLRDLEQLWRRIAFSIAIHNTDDHLRNHGFLRGRSGWILSPAFDMNPNPYVAASRSTSIGYESEPKKEFGGLMNSAKYFQINGARAKEMWSEIITGVSKWREVASSHGISASEKKQFSPVFDRHLN